MRYLKTSLGREALRHRDPRLSPQERQLLILCTGERDVDELGRLMCAPMDDVVERLAALGFLRRADDTEWAPSTWAPSTVFSSTMLPTEWSASQLMQTRPPVDDVAAARAAIEAALAVAAASRSSLEGGPLRTRRSMASVKMYLLGVVELQRSSHGRAQAIALHRPTTPDDFLIVAINCLRWLHQRNGPSYARRVVRKTAPAIPP